MQTAFPVESISLNPSNKSFLVALTDGSLTLWHLETLQELYQYKHDGPVHGLTFTEPDDFYFFSADQVLQEQPNTNLLTLGRNVRHHC